MRIIYIISISTMLCPPGELQINAVTERQSSPWWNKVILTLFQWIVFHQTLWSPDMKKSRWWYSSGSFFLATLISQYQRELCRLLKEKTNRQSYPAMNSVNFNNDPSRKRRVHGCSSSANVMDVTNFVVTVFKASSTVETYTWLCKYNQELMAGMLKGSR